MADQNKMMILLIKGAISELTENQQARTMEAHEKLNAIVEEYGGEGLIALALLGAEKGAEE